MKMSLTITNPRIIQFYESHPHISLEHMNLFLMEMLEKMLQETVPSLTPSFATKLLEQVNELQKQMIKTQQEQQVQHWTKMAEMKRDYMEDLKLILSHNNSEKISPLIQQSTQHLEDKMKVWLQETLPKTQETFLSMKLKEFSNEIQKDTTQLLQTSLNKQNLDEFITNIDNRFAKTLVTSQTFLNNMISSSEQRIQQKMTSLSETSDIHIRELREISTGNQHSQTQLQTHVNELLKKMENSSSKGKVSENLLMGVLQNLYPCAQIDFVGTAKETGDILMYRQDKPTILFENKNYDKNVVQEEVKKFLRDVEIQNCCGIMIAQHYGIAHKENYEMDIHNGNVLVYVHKVEYDPEKIKIAVDLIDHFKSTMNEMDYDTETIQLEKETLESINKEYQSFIANRMNQTKMIKEYTSKLLAQLDELKLPQLEHFLSKHFASTVSKENICPYCQYVAKNSRALTAHFRGCQKKNT